MSMITSCMQHQASIVQHGGSPVAQANTMRTRAHNGLRDLIYSIKRSGVYLFFGICNGRLFEVSVY